MRLVTFNHDWADEFSPYGFAIMTEEEFTKFREYYSKPRTWFFGTNEGFEDEVLFPGCTVTEIYPKDVDTLKRVFNLKDSDWRYLGAGLFPSQPKDDDENL